MGCAWESAHIHSDFSYDGLGAASGNAREFINGLYGSAVLLHITPDHLIQVGNTPSHIINMVNDLGKELGPQRCGLGRQRL